MFTVDMQFSSNFMLTNYVLIVPQDHDLGLATLPRLQFLHYLLYPTPLKQLLFSSSFQAILFSQIGRENENDLSSVYFHSLSVMLSPINYCHSKMINPLLSYSFSVTFTCNVYFNESGKSNSIHLYIVIIKQRSQYPIRSTVYIHSLHSWPVRVFLLSLLSCPTASSIDSYNSCCSAVLKICSKYPFQSSQINRELACFYSCYHFVKYYESYVQLSKQYNQIIKKPMTLSVT